MDMKGFCAEDSKNGPERIFLDLQTSIFFFPTRRVNWTIKFFKGTRRKGRSRQRQGGRVKGQLRRKGKGRRKTLQGFVCAPKF